MDGYWACVRVEGGLVWRHRSDFNKRVQQRGPVVYEAQRWSKVDHRWVAVGTFPTLAEAKAGV